MYLQANFRTRARADSNGLIRETWWIFDLSLQHLTTYFFWAINASDSMLQSNQPDSKAFYLLIFRGI